MGESGMTYTYTIFDDGGAGGSGTAWPSHYDIEIEASSDEEVIEKVRDILSSEARGLSAADGYDVGDRIHAIVWDSDGTFVGQPAYALTAADLGSALRSDADTSHEDASDWYNSYGWHLDTESAGSVTVQAVDYDWLDDQDDSAVVDQLLEVNDLLTRDEAEEIVAKGRDVREAAELIVSLLEQAVAAYESGDLSATLAALDEASSAEREHGDDPATSALRSQLLRRRLRPAPLRPTSPRGGSEGNPAPRKERGMIELSHPELRSRAAVSYRVGSLGELHQIPPEGLDDEQLYTLITLTGVEWYDAAGNRTDSPPFGGDAAGALTRDAPQSADESGAHGSAETADDYSRRKPETRVGGSWSRRSRGE